MLRPIPPQAAWQAITALAGFFTLVGALAAPVDLWRLTVKSRQGEPFLAIATLDSLPQEHISNECLFMGPESDAPGSEMPFLRKANLKLNAAGSAVEISTEEPIAAPALALVLRVQCAGAPLYARHFSALIAPALPKTPAHGASAQSVQRPGFRLSLLPGDTVESIAAVLFPAHRGTQQNLVHQVLAGNPKIFPDGRSREVAAGTVLWFPDLRELRKSAKADSAAPVKSSAQTNATRRSSRATATPAGDSVIDATPAKPRAAITLRRALELGDKPGPQECKQLMQLCGADATAVTVVTPGLEEKARALDSGVKELHLKQDSIDQQLQRLEQSLRTVQQAINTAPVPVQPAPAPPRVETRTVVKSEPISWTIWLGLAGLILAAAIGGFAAGRRGTLSRGLAENDEQLDRMLATAANVMRELESTPEPAPAPKRIVAAPPPRPVASPQEERRSEPPPATESARVPDLVLDPEAMQPSGGLDLELKSERPAPPHVSGLSNDLLYEMDQALDNTRSMFTDVDRFIALGRTQNALSLLQFQVHKDPKDRDSWIKLMAIYRQEKMDDELAKAAHQFRNNFPNENPPAV